KKETSMDALSLLKEDHQKVKKLVKEVEGTTARSTKQREELFQTIVDELTVHERIEEEIFYPRLQKHEKAKDLVLESYVEHGVVDDLLDEISTIAAGDEKWLPAFKVFRENLEHHIEEEEKELFPKINQQERDRVIAWRSISGAPNEGVVRFEPHDGDKTKIELELHWEPKDATERVGDVLGADDLRVQGDLKRFKEFVESRGAPTG